MPFILQSWRAGSPDVCRPLDDRPSRLLRRRPQQHRIAGYAALPAMTTSGRVDGAHPAALTAAPTGSPIRAGAAARAARGPTHDRPGRLSARSRPLMPRARIWRGVAPAGPLVSPRQLGRSRRPAPPCLRDRERRPPSRPELPGTGVEPAGRAGREHLPARRALGAHSRTAAFSCAVRSWSAAGRAVPRPAAPRRLTAARSFAAGRPPR